MHSSSSHTIDLMVQSLTGEKRVVYDVPIYLAQSKFTIAGVGGKLVPGGEGYTKTTIEKRDDGSYWIQTKVPYGRYAKGCV